MSQEANTAWRIVIVEDDEQTRLSLQERIGLADDMDVIVSAGTLAEGREAIKAQPDVLLVDLGLPDGSGQQLIEETTAYAPRTEIMVITVFGDEQNVVSAIQAGASGYLLKDSEGPDMASAIRELVAGGSPITPAIARHILKRFNSDRRQPKTDASSSQSLLTDREIEVLDLVVRGYSNNEIGSLLQVSYHTVTSHIKNIYKKLAVGSRTEAIYEANQLGLLSPERKTP